MTAPARTRAGGRYVEVHVDEYVEVWVPDEDLEEPAARTSRDAAVEMLPAVTSELHEAKHDRMPWVLCSQEPCRSVAVVEGWRELR